MAANLHYATAGRNAALDTITSQVGASGLLKFYTGTQPADVQTGLSGNTLLVTLTCSATFAPAASSGVLTLNAITAGTAVATGTATWATYTTSGGTRILDLSVGTSSADIILTTTSIQSGASVTMSSQTFTFPA